MDRTDARPAPTLSAHPSRAAILAEIHARPFAPLETPRRLLHFAFMTDQAQANADREALARFCEGRGVAAPADGAKHHRARLGESGLRWEQHSEFTTYSWELPGNGSTPFAPGSNALPHHMLELPQPGPHLVAVDLHLLPQRAAPPLEEIFDPASLAASLVDGEAGLAATDFRPCPDGFVRILVLDRALTPSRAGALAQRLLEIETYRVLALLGLPEAQRLAPSVRATEEALVRIAGTMTQTDGLAADNALLDEMTALAAPMESEAASSNYRFGASRAYDNIVHQRLAAIDEVAYGGWPTIAAFLSRRMAPAMRTCQMLQERQADLSRKLARAANLLRTRVDVALEQQNRDLLAAMNERARMQLRLQQTVEGLSVAAIGYYVVSLFGYLAKGAKDAGYLPVDVGIATALFVPFALFGVWSMVRRIRRGHSDG
ncbi:MAG TPA: DUF3422 domain-containing protein [Bosea sp. (in: a-proteobacteria)]|jgi:uncharacterized membrane-anchored protein|uniref:DUF3422 family protein n=1 Tax=Bosea sp. (in: a-proteobacteria) TaxID=1871050 RepID=UPI002E0E7566|nr:DUF3422 domain-containing protein [Bosea sp. (in: a-proteobacteria)]